MIDDPRELIVRSAGQRKADVLGQTIFFRESIHRAPASAKRPEQRRRPDPGRTNVVGGLQRERKPSTMGSDQVAERLSSLTVGDSPGTPGVSTLLHQQRREPVLPEQALRLTRPTDGFLCPLSANKYKICLLYTSPSPRDATLSRMPSSA